MKKSVFWSLGMSGLIPAALLLGLVLMMPTQAQAKAAATATATITMTATLTTTTATLVPTDTLTGTTPTVVPTATLTATAPLTGPAALGTPQTLGAVQIVPSQALTYTAIGTLKIQAQYTYLVISVTVQNTGTKSLLFSPNNFYLTDTKTKALYYLSNVRTLKGKIFSQWIKADNKIEGVICYIVLASEQNEGIRPR